jgi:hypothetical protein
VGRPEATQLTKSTTYPSTTYGKPFALFKPWDMLNRFKFGIENGKRTSRRPLIVFLLLVASLSPMKLHAEDRHTAVAKLQIQVTVVPIVVAMQQAHRSESQPSQSPVSFNLTPEMKQQSAVSTQTVSIPDKSGSMKTAVLTTETIVSQ